MSRKLIDTHVHVWDLERADYPWLKGDKSLLNKTWLIQQLEEERIKAGVIEGILVQASGNIEDTELMFETAENTKWISGVVAWLPLMDPDATEDILDNDFANQPYFKGVRHQIHDEPDPAWLLQPEVMESLQILAKRDIPYDVVGIHPAHIETVLMVASKIPGLRMVFDHLNQPPIGSGEKFGRWGDLMKEAAAHPQLYAKISGLGTTTGKGHQWTAENIRPYIAYVLEHFGHDRCFCGGDWPVSLLAGSYSGTWKIYQDVITGLAGQESDNIFYTNARQFYSL